MYEICYRVVETKDRNQRLTDGMHVRELDGWADIHKPLTSESEMDCGLVKFEDMPELRLHLSMALAACTG